MTAILLAAHCQAKGPVSAHPQGVMSRRESRWLAVLSDVPPCTTSRRGASLVHALFALCRGADYCVIGI